ncbi:MAG: hypothetical protein L0Y56_11725, partial [Nitrospira sp.]|nr:hypothetical protein [Nitrospira sp.]
MKTARRAFIVHLTIFACGGSFAIPLARADCVLVTLQLKQSVSPPDISLPPYFGITSLDSIGDYFGIEHLRSLTGKPTVIENEDPDLARFYIAIFPEGVNLTAVLGSYLADDHIEIAEPDTTDLEFYDLPVKPDDVYFQNQWALDNTGPAQHACSGIFCSDGWTDMDLPEAWDLQAGGDTNVVVAVIDGEILQVHPDINLSLWWNPEEVADSLDNETGREAGQIDDFHGWNFNYDPNN